MTYRLVCDCCQASYEPEQRAETFTVHHELKYGIETQKADYELCPECTRFIKKWFQTHGTFLQEK